jgi:hypothetical protein
MGVREKRNAALAQRTITGLKNKNIEAFFVETKEEALRKALELIPEEATVGWGGSASIGEIGLLDVVRTGNYRVIDRSMATNPEEKNRLQLEAFGADVFLGSVNALSEDGVMVNIDKIGNRIGAYCYGPGQLLLVVGMNKVVKTAEDALARARNEAAPINAQRFGIDTPCVKNGSCSNCKSMDTICANILVTRFNPVAGRIKVILVNEELGF